ncbi:tetratricopeptide repeat protein [Pedobacter xixiisoli]|uniref:Tetratricopeptide repeat-containing protein n=1 Tax=Pedobacter xixiisoli TaxID=1476464 RepID=A0A286AER4_9SPHI|nr:tetratricopeptide repeat protein [Pedobacter xixiisoli]SOD20377.1 Tetratricopeptide repeat-containing protein [Pedobacter xixiisoli]
MNKLFFTVILIGLCFTIQAQQTPVAVRDSNAIKELFFAGLKEKLTENYVDASSSFSKILAIDPNNNAAHFELANIQLRQNKLLDAEVSIKKALTVQPNNTWYLKLQTEIYKRSGNMDALVQVFNRLIKLEPEAENYYFDRANALYISGKVDESKKAYDLLEEKFGVTKSSTAAKQRFKSQTELTNGDDLHKLIKDNPSDVKNYLDLSGTLLEKNQNDEALAVLLKAKNMDADNYEIDLALADVYHALKKPQEAFTSLKLAFSSTEMPLPTKVKILSQLLLRFSKPEVVKNATELGLITLNGHKDDAKVVVLYGDILYQQGNLSGAREQYLTAIKLSEQLYIAWEKLLGVQTLMGSYAEAIKMGEQALTIYPNQAILYYYRAFALHRNGQNAEAAFELKNALQLEPEDNNLKAMILALQAEVMIDQGKLKEADAAFDKAVALAPNNYLTMSNYAYYLALRNHDLPKAEKLASKAASALPQNSSILDTYAIVLFKLNRIDDALTYIQKALQNNDTDNPVYLEHYGDILSLKGDKENAVVQWQKAKTAGNQSEKLNRKINEKKYIK